MTNEEVKGKRLEKENVQTIAADCNREIHEHIMHLKSSFGCLLALVSDKCINFHIFILRYSKNPRVSP